MKRKIYSVIAVALMVLLTMAACHNEEQYDRTCQVRVKLFAKEHISVSRGYKPLADTTLANFDASLFVALGTNLYHTTMTGNNTSMSIEAGNYTFYSCMPKMNPEAFDLDERTLTLTDIKGLGTTDIMVGNGVAMQVGASSSNSTVEVPMYMDHLMARITPCFYVHEQYAAMRTIKVKKVEMIMPADTLYTAQIVYEEAADVNATLSYAATWNKGNPTEETMTMVTTYEETASPVALTTTRGGQEYGSCYLCPEKMTEGMRLRVTYDVYDTKGVLTRPDAVAENRIKRLPALLTAGTNYRLHVKIVPTYLYALSDHDNGTEIFIVDEN